MCQGELEVYKCGSQGSEVRLAVLHPGDCVAEMSLIDIQPRSTTVRALTPAVLFCLSNAQIARLTSGPSTST
ncbi:MAG TPA: cyclic nucleotide-binding domain-containing protein [Polyangia bacterium]|nr:cyclic nucleotide-binding domain-containing protein [Polyangia bacterium]